MPHRRSKLRTRSNLCAAVVLTLGAVHAEACVPVLIQFATARPDAPAALVALFYHRLILSLMSTLLPRRPTTTPRRTAVVQAIREMELHSGRTKYASSHLCAPPCSYVTWIFIVSYAVAFLHYNTCVACVMLFYVYLPVIFQTVLAIAHESFKTACATKDPMSALVVAAHRAILTVMAAAPLEESSVASDGENSSDSGDESLDSDEYVSSDSEADGECSQGLLERIGVFMFGAAHERTYDECKAIAMRRRMRDPRPDIARPSPEHLLKIEEEEYRRELQRRKNVSRRQRARCSAWLQFSPPTPYQLGYIAFPLPEPPCPDVVNHAPRHKPSFFSQTTQAQFTHQPNVQGIFFAKPAPSSFGSNDIPNQACSRFASTTSPFAAAASAFSFNRPTSSCSTPAPNATDNAPLPAQQPFSFVNPAPSATPRNNTVNNPFAAYASPTSPFVTGASAFSLSNASPTPEASAPIKNMNDASNSGNIQSAASQPFTFLDPAAYAASSEAAKNPFAAYVSPTSPFATSASASSPANNASSTPAASTPVQNNHVPTVASTQSPAGQPFTASPSNTDKNPFAAYASPLSPFATGASALGYNKSSPAAAFGQQAPAQNAMPDVQRDEGGYEIVDESAYYAPGTLTSKDVEQHTIQPTALGVTPSVPTPTTPSKSSSETTSIPRATPASPVQKFVNTSDCLATLQANVTSALLTPTTSRTPVPEPDALPDNIVSAFSRHSQLSPTVSTSPATTASATLKATHTDTPVSPIPQQLASLPDVPAAPSSPILITSEPALSSDTALIPVASSPISLPAPLSNTPLALPPPPRRRSPAPSPPSIPHVASAPSTVQSTKQQSIRLQPFDLGLQEKLIANENKPKKVAFRDILLEDEIAETIGSGARDNARAMPDMSDEEDGTVTMPVVSTPGGVQSRKPKAKDFRHADPATLSQRKMRTLPRSRMAMDTGDQATAISSVTPISIATSAGNTQDILQAPLASCSVSAPKVVAPVQVASPAPVVREDEPDEGDPAELDRELNDLLSKLPDKTVPDDVILNINDWAPPSG